MNPIQKTRVWDVTFDTGKQYKVVAFDIEDAIKKAREALPADMQRAAKVVGINSVCELDVT